jgi:HEAT repeat protein
LSPSPAEGPGRGAARPAPRREGQGEERVVWLAMALGRTASPRAVTVLVDLLQGPAAEGAPSTDVRRAAAFGLTFLESRAAEPALVRLLETDLDPEVRVVAASGLALLGRERSGGAAGDGPEVGPALRRALDHPHAGVRLNAAWGLALRGDDAGLGLVRQSLDREALRGLQVHEVAHQRNALLNGIHAALRLRDPSLRPLVERLTQTRHEPDEGVRHRAATALEEWDGAGTGGV